LTDLDEYGFRRTQRLVAEEIGRLGLGRVRMLEVPWPSLPTPWVAGNHHIATTRMHESPQFGVVNADGRVHSVENLFMAGSSVFSTTSAGTPTLLIVALALRLSDHLKERFLR
jgi:choline dehydrogenase-like flavoprotein